MFRSMHFGPLVSSIGALGALMRPTMARPWMTPPRPGGRSIARLNRSRHWDSARSYQEARELSPVRGRPVR